MSRRAVRDARLVRGLIVAGCGAGLALAGHLVAGGTVPGDPTVLLLVLLAAAGCVLVSDHEWSLRRLVVALGAVQLIVHLGLGLDHGAMHGAAGALPGTTGRSSGWIMLCAHAVAALISAWLLRSGEAAYWRVVEHLLRRPPVRAVAARVPARPRVAVCADPDTLESLLCLSTTVSRRGPPTRVA